jgi:UDPglucose 6-dehydrogenase
MQIGIVGHGVVGKHLTMMFENAHEVVIYDKHKVEYSDERSKAAINQSDVVFIAVPTPQTEVGGCDTTEVIDAITWITPPICIKSTIVPGTTDRLVRDFNKAIVFSPEYIGETSYHLYKSRMDVDVVTVGGDDETCKLFLRLLRSVLGPEPKYFQTTAVTAELAKYMENCFLATKVAFVGEFYLLAELFGVNFTTMREIWCADPRIGRSHSTVTEQLGFGGKCLPKDLSALIVEAAAHGYNPPLLGGVQQSNGLLSKIKIN